MNAEMNNKYLASKIKMGNGQLVHRDDRFCKNGSIFDLTGTKILWGDIGPDYVDKMYGVYYVLSEHKSFWSVDKRFVKQWSPISDDPNSLSPFRSFLPLLEPYQFDISYIKNNAIARINDGKIETNRTIISNNFQ